MTWKLAVLAGTLTGMFLVGCSENGTKPDGQAVFIRLTTTAGAIVLQLDPEKAPVTVENFLRYVDSGFYEGTTFHRVIPGFVIQGGGFTADMAPKPATYPPIQLESDNGLKNVRGTIAMARASIPNSATTQFFINLKDSKTLDYNPALPAPNGYAVFGKVVYGMAVVDSIATVSTGRQGDYQNVPVVPIVITSVRIIGP